MSVLHLIYFEPRLGNLLRHTSLRNLLIHTLMPGGKSLKSIPRYLRLPVISMLSLIVITYINADLRLRGSSQVYIKEKGKKF